jgi:hypothetical protein
LVLTIVVIVVGVIDFMGKLFRSLKEMQIDPAKVLIYE